MIVISTEHLQQVQKILSKYPYTFYVFGSRVRGATHPLSDLNLCFMEEIPLETYAQIQASFDGSTLPFKVDITNWTQWSDALKARVRPDLMLFQRGSNYQLNSEVTFPIPMHKGTCFLKNIIQNPNIRVGDFTYYHDFEDVHHFEKNVRYHFGWLGDCLQIGRFCQIASDVTFLMNGGNHAIGPSTYPFWVFSGTEEPLNLSEAFKGDIVVGHDVWIGYKATILSGVHIGNGAIVGANSLVTKNVPPYTIVGGNPAQTIRQRFSDEMIQWMQANQWWHWDIQTIQKHARSLQSGDLSVLQAIQS
jgi:virginiamycin A acetyltransferase